AMKHLGTLLKDRGKRAEAEPLLRQSQEALRHAEMRRIPCLVQEFPWKVHMMAVAFSPDSRRLLAGGDDDCIRLLDVATGMEIHRFVGTGGVLSVTFSPDGRRALSGSGDKTVQLWDVTTARELRKLEGHTGPVLSAVFSPDGRRVLSAGGDGD